MEFTPELDRRFLGNIVSTGQSAADIVENMLSFARKSPTDKEVCFLEDIIDKTLALMKNDFVLKDKYDFQHISILKEYESKEMPVLCGESKISQVLLNLFRNAVQAMRDSRGNTPDPCITIRLFRENKMACMVVKDNGPGMDASVKKQIFEPFFTTRQIQEGTIPLIYTLTLHKIFQKQLHFHAAFCNTSIKCNKSF